MGGDSGYRLAPPSWPPWLPAQALPPLAPRGLLMSCYPRLRSKRKGGLREALPRSRQGSRAIARSAVNQEARPPLHSKSAAGPPWPW